MSVLDYRSAAAERSSLSRIGDWLGWAVYLGMSWTWCIGMFLPVLLVRDYGFWAWVIFAVPNVVGAAAMGWVLKDGDSEEIVLNHSSAISIFSIVTVAYQIFFAWWIFSRFGDPGWFWGTIVLSVLMFAMLRSGSWRRNFLAVVIFLISIGCLVAWSSQFESIWDIPRLFDKPQSEAAGLIPLCVFGFLLCPYLDRTFHLARQRMNSGVARAGFSVGFGVFFLTMIVFSLIYALNGQLLFSAGLLYWPIRLIFIHWMFQLAFTVAAHCSSGRDVETLPRDCRYLEIVVPILLAVIGVCLTKRISQHGGIDSGELIYRGFLGFYGLLFPGYVWVCIIPGRGRLRPLLSQWIVLSIAIVVAGPMFWMAFIERKMIWAVPGVAVVLLSRVFVTARRGPVVDHAEVAPVG